MPLENCCRLLWREGKLLDKNRRVKSLKNKAKKRNWKKKNKENEDERSKSWLKDVKIALKALKRIKIIWSQ